jgi:hypothetical protein
MVAEKFYAKNSDTLYEAEKAFLRATFEEGKANKVIDAVRNAIRNSSNYVGMDKNYRSVLSTFSVALNHTNDMVRRIGGVLYCEPFTNCLSILDKDEITKQDMNDLQSALKKSMVINKKKALQEMG